MWNNCVGFYLENLAAGDDDEALDSPTHEFVSDTFQGNKISEEEVKLGMKQLGMGDKAGNITALNIASITTFGFPMQ